MTKKRLGLLASMRLLVFLVLVTAVYLLWGSAWLWGMVPFGIALFLWLVTRYTNLKSEKGYLERLIKINETELSVLDRKFHHLPDGKEFLKQDHPYAQDLDLFGRGSFYQYLNRTALDQGSGVLSELLLDDGPKSIQQKQEAIKELAKLPEWRQRFWALAGGTRPEVSHQVVSKWLKEHRSIVPTWAKYVAPGFALGSIAWIIAFAMGVIPEALVLFWYVLGIFIVGRYAKPIMAFSSKISQVQDTIDQYQKLISELEDTEFQSELLRNLKQRLTVDGEKTSHVLKTFRQSLAMLDQQHNLLVLMFGQGLFLYSLYFAYRVESWVVRYGDQVEGWFEAIAYFDAYNCLGNYAFNHLDHSFPELCDDKKALSAKEVGHPLIDPAKNVLNDFSIDKGHFFFFFLANMAGKSTFLLSVGLPIVMSNIVL
ncbi:MAG: DNA mismatch repair protein MutS, partial [Muricauda sp.]|nr:DNA mismatch repair protein MutS [Allomuricauda sp.]